MPLRLARIGAAALAMLGAAPASAAGPAADPCGAAAAQRFVGRPVEEARAALTPGPDTRIACEECPVTFDFRPNRLTVRFARDGRVTSASCIN